MGVNPIMFKIGQTIFVEDKCANQFFIPQTPYFLAKRKKSKNIESRVMREYRSQRIPTTNRGQKVVKLVDTSELISISILGQPREDQPNLEKS